ncbi:MAG: ATP-binding protein [Methanosphaera sp.]|nr:ATP-binding protein [Methanosphaera sp.]
MIKREEYLKVFYNYLDTDFIKIVIGLRRCGKTTFLRSIIEELKSLGINDKNIIYISFENVKYKYIKTSKELDEVVLDKVKDIEGKVYLLFDEIQLVDNWEESINSYRVSFDSDIYVTGSNSKLFSSELSTLIAGRYVHINIYPFSFKEFLTYHNEINNVKMGKNEIYDYFRQYIQYGGMPSLLSLKNEESKNNVLLDIYDSIIINDILSRHEIRRIDTFKRFVYFIMNSIGQTFSKKSIANYLKSESKKTSRETINNYTNFIVESLFCQRVLREDILRKRLLSTEEKYYLTDHGFHQALIDENDNWLPRILENIVYIELLRRGYSVKVGRIKNKEVDFIAKNKNNKIYIQVAYLLASDETIEREFSVLLDIPDKYDAYVLSMDEFNMSRYGIKHMNIIDFLLTDEI